MLDYTDSAGPDQTTLAATTRRDEPGRSGGNLPLGTIARFASPSVYEPSRVAHRFALQSAARELLPSERVAICLRRPIPGRQLVDVFHAPLSRSAHFGGLQVCGSVWGCPVCAAKISERRRVELSAGLLSWDGRAVLVTFTLQHNSSERLLTLLEGLLGGYRALRSGKFWPAFSARHSLAGSVRSLEVTYGSNGWHPHLHVLMLLRSELAIIPFEADLKRQWSKVLARTGHNASWAHGVDVRFSDASVADYVAKFGRQSDWTVVHEVTKAVVKQGRSGGRSPLQLLGDSVLGDEPAGQLWVEYYRAFKGRKQLVWSRGLRQLLGLVVDEKSDEELAEEKDQAAILLAQLTLLQWRRVLSNDARGELLEVAAFGDLDKFNSFLELLGV